MKLICASGFFNPLHVGHIRYLQEAKKLGDKLIVIVNTDEQVKLKGSFPFMNEEDRLEIVKSLQCVDEAILAIDLDGSVCETLKFLKPNVFAKGGDRTRDNIPEVPVCEALGIEMIFGVGGGKIRASSELINKFDKKY
jgi:D-beta-D-heptose 7-phosphate kinase/D-beta-D-heptose 1-phosphate adenosyltransferase